MENFEQKNTSLEKFDMWNLNTEELYKHAVDFMHHVEKLNAAYEILNMVQKEKQEAQNRFNKAVEDCGMNPLIGSQASQLCRILIAMHDKR